MVEIQCLVPGREKVPSQSCKHPFLMDQQPSKLSEELCRRSIDLQLQTITSMEQREPANINLHDVLILLMLLMRKDGGTVNYSYNELS